MQPKAALTLALLLIAIIAFAGCTGTQSPTAAPATQTPSAAGAAAPAASPSVAGASLVPSPTDDVVAARQVNINVEKDYLGNVIYTFQGGAGLIHVKKIDITLDRADGTTETGTLGITVDSTATLEGTKNTDRAIVSVTLDDGNTYKMVDTLVPFKQI
jgi:hypothetical protein